MHRTNIEIGSQICNYYLLHKCLCQRLSFFSDLWLSVSRYVKSRSDKQLRSKANKYKTKDCSPEATVLVSNKEMPIVPCGLIAWSMFNDTYGFSLNDKAIQVNKKGIAWKSDREYKFGSDVYPKNFQSGVIGGAKLDDNIPVSIFVFSFLFLFLYIFYLLCSCSLCCSTVKQARGSYCLDANCSVAKLPKALWKDRGGSWSEWEDNGCNSEQLQHLQFWRKKDAGPFDHKLDWREERFPWCSIPYSWWTLLVYGDNLHLSICCQTKVSESPFSIALHMRLFLWTIKECVGKFLDVLRLYLDQGFREDLWREKKNKEKRLNMSRRIHQIFPFFSFSKHCLSEEVECPT